MCHVLEVGRSSYYDWVNRPLSKLEMEDTDIEEKICQIFKESDSTYGHRRLKKSLWKKYQIKCSNERVRRPMRELSLVPVQTRKFKATSNTLPVAPNLLQQDFTASAPCQKWVGDITYVPTRESWLYLATVIDLFSRKVAGWAISECMTKQLVIDAMEMAITNEHPEAGLIFHSDWGSQYASYDFQGLLRAHRVKQSMSDRGDCYDNAWAESFFATIKKDLIHRRRFSTRSEATLEMVNYIVS
jgi:putative transposase